MHLSLTICLIIFVIVLIIFEKKSSIKLFIRWILSLFGMYFYIKSIVDGKSIIIMSIILVTFLAIVNIYIKNGISKKSLSELLSVLLITIFSGGIIFIICKNLNLNILNDEIMKFNGIKNSEDAIFGISLIAIFGIYLDIISKIIVDLDENKDKTIDIIFKEQFKQGVGIGKRLFSEKVIMIFLIFLSNSLFQICSNLNNNMNIIESIEQVTVFPYILIAMITNIGVFISIPMTSCMYAWLNRKKIIYKKSSENRIDGKRSLKI